MGLLKGNVGLFGMGRWLIVLVLGLVCFGLVSGGGYVPGEIIVKYKEDVGMKSFSIKSGNEGSLEILKVDKNTDLEKMAMEISLLSGVEYAEPNYIYDIFVEPNDPDYSSQWYLPKVQSEEAWNLTFGSEDVIIAIIDTGVEWDHIDLADNIWNNSDEDCSNGIDDDSNGYIDDCRGWDFVDTSNVNCTDADCTGRDNNPMDDNEHGTHCAGISAAVTNNSNQVSGICPNCKIMAVRSGYKCTGINCPSGASLNIDDTSLAIEYAADNGATVISMSFGGTDDFQSIRDAVNYANSKGVALVAAAGNSNSNVENYPAANPNVIAIGSTDSGDLKSSFSNYGNWVNIVAPGSNIWNTVLNDQIKSKQGTSMATPLVAGAIGLIKSVLPDKTQTDILQALNETGTPINFIGENKSRVNVYSSLLYLDDIVPAINFSGIENGSVSVNVNQTFVFNFTDWQLKNATFRLYNESYLINESLFNLSGIWNSSTVEIKDLSYGDYVWECFSYDENENYFSLGNSSFSITNVVANLISPANNSYVNYGNVSFNCSAQSTSSLSNMTFYLYNSSGLINWTTYNLNGTHNSSVFNYTFSNEDSYSWGCEAYNGAGHRTDNFSITYDVTVPVIGSLTSSSTYNAAEISFSSEDVNYSLDYSGGNVNSSEYSQSGLISLTGLLASRTYEYNLTVCDRAGNCNFTSSSFSTESAPSSGGSSSSSSPSSGGDGSVIEKGSIGSPVSYSDIVSEGYSETYEKNESRHFEDSSGESHSIMFSDLVNGVVIIVVRSDPVEIHLLENQSYKLNLTSSVYYDFEIFVDSIDNDMVTLTIKAISEMIPVEEKFDIFENKSLAEVEDSELDQEIDLVWILVGIVGLVGLIWFWMKDEKLEKKIVRKKLKHVRKFEKKLKRSGTRKK